MNLNSLYSYDLTKNKTKIASFRGRGVVGGFRVFWVLSDYDSFKFIKMVTIRIDC